MKNTNLFLIAVIGSSLISCGSWVRIGDLTSVSNRNLDESKNYILLNRDVESIAKTNSDAMEQAIDNLTKKYEGEFIRNAKIYVRSNGKKVKIIGDVWGVQNTMVAINTSASAEIKLEIGDSVVFKRKGDIIDGKIIGVNANVLIVEYGKGKRAELRFDEVTKTNK